MARGRNCEQVVDLNGEVCGRWVPSFAVQCSSCGSVVSTRAERIRRGAAIAARMVGYFEEVNKGGDIDLCRSAHLARKRRAATKAALLRTHLRIV